MVARFSVSLAQRLAQDEIGPEFVVSTKDPHAGMPYPLEGSLAITGTDGGATVEIQQKIGGVWHTSNVNGEVPVSAFLMRAMHTVDTVACIRVSPHGDVYRVAVIGGDGTTAIDVTYLPLGLAVEILS